MIRWRLRVIMADRGMTNQELAEKVQLNPVTVSKLKNAKGMPRLHESTLNGLCNALRCTPNDLIEYTPDAELGRSTSGEC